MLNSALTSVSPTLWKRLLDGAPDFGIEVLVALSPDGADRADPIVQIWTNMPGSVFPERHRTVLNCNPNCTRCVTVGAPGQSVQVIDRFDDGGARIVGRRQVAE
ncbi:hypothetical protein [Nonomuraea sp. NPDC049158]|uniref:hypothetical protein n=1 Tax=Nonomuraea sp. NPDC049158 TaxID=3155649 RepID=UPI0033F4E18C